MGDWRLVKKALEDPGVCYILFRRRTFTREQVLEILREVGVEEPNVQESAVFWRLSVRPVPKGNLQAFLLPLEDGIFALGAKEAEDDPQDHHLQRHGDHPG